MRPIQVRRNERKSDNPIYHGWRRVAYSWPVLILVALVLVFMGRASYRVYLRWDKARIERNEAEARYQAELARQVKLENNVARLKTERGWEEELRKNFQVAKPGEGVIMIVGTGTVR
ncbi:MAG TPA: hypothetical protein VJK09_02880 [Candidatus Paceibacterota bacterium]